MEDLESIILKHYQRYPKMEIADFVKLIFQNEFGGGHLIKDEAKAKEFLIKEYESVKDDSKDVIKEYIGNGFYRYYLYHIDLDINDLIKVFIDSNSSLIGSVESFENKLEILRNLTIKGCFDFNINDLDCYLKKYREDGYPIVSHSKTYKELYKPSYRVIKDIER